MDWESAYVQCPPFGVGKGPYGCCRYYYYRGMLHGTSEALETWTALYGTEEGNG